MAKRPLVPGGARAARIRLQRDEFLLLTFPVLPAYRNVILTRCHVLRAEFRDPDARNGPFMGSRDGRQPGPEMHATG